MNQHPFRVLRPLDDDFDWHRHRAADAYRRLAAAKPPPDLSDHRAGARAYRPHPDLVTAVNTAIQLRAPLLVTGEPGTGKTQLAWFLAAYFDIAIFPYTVRSTSTAADLRYDFDAVGYLRDAYLAQARDRGPADGAPAPDHHPDADPRMRHITKGPLWQAFTQPKSCVLLIDEIDKAPRDFPNDLLQELDNLEFPHPFSQDEAHAIRAHRDRLPILIVTSNLERRLPDAFLRRCIVHDIRLDDDLINQAVAAHGAAFHDLNPELCETAIRRFQELRQVDRLSRRPGIAELLAWLVTLARSDQAIRTPADLAGPLHALPHIQCLVKDAEDRALLAQQARR